MEFINIKKSRYITKHLNHMNLFSNSINLIEGVFEKLFYVNPEHIIGDI